MACCVTRDTCHWRPACKQLGSSSFIGMTNMHEPLNISSKFTLIEHWPHETHEEWVLGLKPQFASIRKLTAPAANSVSHIFLKASGNDIPVKRWKNETTLKRGFQFAIQMNASLQAAGLLLGRGVIYRRRRRNCHPYSGSRQGSIGPRL